MRRIQREQRERGQPVARRHEEGEHEDGLHREAGERHEVRAQRAAHQPDPGQPERDDQAAREGEAVLPQQDLQHARVLAIGVDAGVARDLGAVHQLERLLEHDPEPGGGLRCDLAKRRADDEAIRLLGRSDPAQVGLRDQAVPDLEVIRVGDVVELAQHGRVAQAEVHRRGLGDRDEAPRGEPAQRSRAARALPSRRYVVGRVAPRDRRDHERRGHEQRERRAREAPPGAAARSSRRGSRRPRAVQPGSRRDPDEQQREQQQGASAMQRAEPHQHAGDAPGRESLRAPRDQQAPHQRGLQEGVEAPGQQLRVEEDRGAAEGPDRGGEQRRRGAREELAPDRPDQPAGGRPEPRLHDLDRDRMRPRRGVDEAHEPGVEGRAEECLRAAASFPRANRSPRRGRGARRSAGSSARRRGPARPPDRYASRRQSASRQMPAMPTQRVRAGPRRRVPSRAPPDRFRASLHVGRGV